MREFLTIEELRALIAVPCRYDIVKKAFLVFLLHRASVQRHESLEME